MDDTQCVQQRPANKCKELQFKEQHMKLASPPTIINEEEEYKVEEV